MLKKIATGIIFSAVVMSTTAMADKYAPNNVFGGGKQKIHNVSDLDIEIKPYNGVLLERQMMLQGVQMDLFEGLHFQGDYYKILSLILKKSKDQLPLLQYLAAEGELGAKQTAALINMMGKQYVSEADLARGKAKEKAILEENARKVHYMDQVIGYNVEERYNPDNDDWARKRTEKPSKPAEQSKGEAPPPPKQLSDQEMIDQLYKMKAISPEKSEELSARIEEIKSRLPKN